MRTNRHWLQVMYGLMLLLIGSCVDPYRPPAITAPNRYLVVDGYLNGGSSSSVVKLSRTQNLEDFSAPTAEQKAIVQVEDEGGMAYPFTEGANGSYTLTSPTLVFGRTYHLRIKTTAGSEYLSDAIVIKQTPKIDSVSWAVENNGLQIYANTHDATGKTRYYRWEFEDTYEIVTPFISPYELVNGQVVARTETDINHCWRTVASTGIFLGSSIRLTQDIIQKAPILFIPASSPKLWIKYSFLLKQYAQSAEAYAYWLNLQKTTEQLGSLFDPLPSQVGGNMHNVKDATEPVLGFVDGYSAEQLRVFIDRPAALSSNLIVTGYENCALDTVPKPGSKLPLSAFLNTSGGYNAVIALDKGLYLATATTCTDCRTLGTTTKPSYWP